ncbi:MAG: lyase family protein, partial [Pseudomonadota bacterium]
EEFSSGSSIMPQKRNPDAAELVRAKSGRIIGSLNGLLLTLKGLPLAYSKDMQEDKEPIFDAADSLMLCLAASAAMIEGMTIHPQRLAAAASAGHPTATDLADWLVRELGLPFRDAHGVAAQSVRRAESLGIDLADLPLEQLQEIEPRITDQAREMLAIERSIESRSSFGGTAPEQVRAAIATARERFL